MSNIAGVVVELEVLQHRELANYFLATWLEYSGKVDSLAKLRACIAREALSFSGRLRSTGTMLDQAGIRSVDAASARMQDIVSHNRQAKRGAGIVITRGLSASGKTTLTTALSGFLGAVDVRNDAEMSRLRSEQIASSPNAADPVKLIERLETLTILATNAGWPVIVESCFLNRANRRRFRSTASMLGVSFAIVECSLPLSVVRQRMNKRRAYGSLFDVADASSDLVEQKVKEQLARRQTLDEQERKLTISVETTGSVDYSRVTEQILGVWGEPIRELTRKHVQRNRSGKGSRCDKPGFVSTRI